MLARSSLTLTNFVWMCRDPSKIERDLTNGPLVAKAIRCSGLGVRETWVLLKIFVGRDHLSIFVLGMFGQVSVISWHNTLSRLAFSLLVSLGILCLIYCRHLTELSRDNLFLFLEPKWPLFLKVNPPKTRPFPIKTRVIWVPGMHRSFFTSVCINTHSVYICAHSLFAHVKWTEQLPKRPYANNYRLFSFTLPIKCLRSLRCHV